MYIQNIIIKKICLTVVSLSVLSIISNAVYATELYDLKIPQGTSISPSRSDSYRLNFRYREATGVSQRLRSQSEILDIKGATRFSSSELNSESSRAFSLEQYDATIYYALEDSFQGIFSRHQWLSIDLGVNFKFIERTYGPIESQHQASFRTQYGAYPMFSASALFDLPLHGMTASFEGSYFNYKTRELSEYRAKLTYQIDNIFGVSGGWEQQQYQLDSTESLRFDKEGPFVDLFYRF